MVAIVLIERKKFTISGTEADTTHNRMELVAVIKAIEFVADNYPFVGTVDIISDSQYVVALSSRKSKLSHVKFITRRGVEIVNAELAKKLFENTEGLTVNFIKIKAHQKKDETTNYNVEADKLSRKMVRELVRKTI